VLSIAECRATAQFRYDPCARFALSGNYKIPALRGFYNDAVGIFRELWIFYSRGHKICLNGERDRAISFLKPFAKIKDGEARNFLRSGMHPQNDIIRGLARDGARRGFALRKIKHISFLIVEIVEFHGVIA